MASDGKEPNTKEPSSSGESFGYLDIPKSSDLNWPKPEGFKEKFLRKSGENPFVPLGLGVTTFALAYGLWQLKTGDKVMSQKMMRLRVAAQGFTVLAVLAGVGYQAYKGNPRKQ